jgi:hypothetical protein
MENDGRGKVAKGEGRGRRTRRVDAGSFRSLDGKLLAAERGFELDVALQRRERRKVSIANDEKTGDTTYVAHMNAVSRVADVDDGSLNLLGAGGKLNGELVVLVVQDLARKADEGRSVHVHVGRVEDLDLVAGRIGLLGDAAVRENSQLRGRERRKRKRRTRSGCFRRPRLSRRGGASQKSGRDARTRPWGSWTRSESRVLRKKRGNSSEGRSPGEETPTHLRLVSKEAAACWENERSKLRSHRGRCRSQRYPEPHR